MKNKGHKYRCRPNKTALLLLKFIFVISHHYSFCNWRIEYQKLPLHYFKHSLSYIIPNFKTIILKIYIWDADCL